MVMALEHPVLTGAVLKKTKVSSNYFFTMCVRSASAKKQTLNNKTKKKSRRVKSRDLGGHLMDLRLSEEVKA